jgi:iron complex outermembrane receptor protein
MDFSLSAKWHLETGWLLIQPMLCSGGSFWWCAAQEISIQFGTILSPRAGLSYSFTKKANPFAALSKGFDSYSR